MDEFKMPAVVVGQVVLWECGDPERPAAAVVTSVGQRSVSLAAFIPNAVNCRPIMGVRHIDDPNKKTHEKEHVGFWRYTEADLELQGSLTVLEEFVKEVQCLRKHVSEAKAELKKLS